MKKPKGWRNFRWNTFIGRVGRGEAVSRLMPMRLWGPGFGRHGVPVELWTWGDNAPLIRRKEIDLYPEFNLER